MADPFTGAIALGCAASLAQIVTLAFHLGKKIYKFTDGQIALPQNLETIKHRLDLMAQTLRDIDTSNYSPEAESSLSSYLFNVDRKLNVFQKMLEDYLPERDASTIDKLKKGIASLGKDNRVAAFADELSKDVDHLSLFLLTQGFASGGDATANMTSHLKGQTIYEVPRRGVVKFVGREDVLTDVNKAITSDPHVAVLYGMGGQGKTQVALEYCRRARQSKLFKAIFWANASSEEAIKESFESFSDLLKAPDQVFMDSDSRIRYVKRVLSEWTEPWLLVLDNFDDPTQFPVRDYMCPGAKSHFLLTSRSSDVRRFGKPIAMSGMKENEGVELCMSTGEIQPTEENVKECTKITQRLGQLPLAIDLAASYIRERAGFMNLDEFLPRYNAQAEAILKLVPGVSEYIENHRENETSVFATYELTLRLMEPDSDLGSKKVSFMNTLGFFNSDHLSENLFRQYYTGSADSRNTAPWFDLFVDEDKKWDSRAFEDFVVRAANLHLVHSASRDADGHLQFSIHPLISDWLRMRQTSEERKNGARNYHLSAAMLSHYLMESYIVFLLQPAFKLSFKQHNAFISHFVAREHWSDFYRNQKPTMIADGKEPLPCVELRFAVFLYDSGFSTTSLKICQRLWDDIGAETNEERIVKRAAGAYMWHNLCTIHSHKEAQEKAKEVAQYWEQTLGAAHPFTLEALHYLAASLSWVGANDESEVVLRDVLGKVTEFDQWDDVCAENCWLPRPVWSLAELAYALSRQRSAVKKKEAAEVMKEVMSQRKTNAAVKKGSYDWAWRHYSLAISLAETPAVKTGLAWELLAIIEKTWGKQHSNYFLAQVEVIGALLDRENRASAEKMTKFLLQGAQTSSHASGYRFMLWGLKRLSAMFLEQNKLIEAEKVLRQMLNINKDMPKSSSALDFVLKDLGLCLFRQCKYIEADASLDSIKSKDLDLLIQQSLVKYKIGSVESLPRARELLTDALVYFVDDGASDETEPDPSGFSLEMMITGSDPTASGPTYKLEVNGCLSCEALVLKGLTEVRVGDLEASTEDITEGMKIFDSSDEKSDLAADFCRFIQAHIETLMEANESPDADLLTDVAIDQLTNLIEWTITTCTTYASTEESLLRQLKKQIFELQELKRAAELDTVSKELEDLSTVTSGSSEASGKSKRSRLASIFSSKSSRGGVNRMESYSSETKTLVPQRTLSASSEEEEATQKKFSSLSAVSGPSESPTPVAAV